jgi:hypothetical protein
MPCGLCAAIPLMKSDEEKPESVVDVNNNNKSFNQITDLNPYHRPAPQR